MDDAVKCTKETLDILAGLAVLVTLPFGLWQFVRTSRKERIEVAERAYREVDIRFVGYLEVAIQHPRLDGYSLPRRSPVDPSLSPEEHEQQRLLYTVLTNVFENAHRLYHAENAPPELEGFRARQWPGWEEYIQRFLKRSAYAAVWEEIRKEYDQPFAAYMNGLLGEPGKVADQKG